MRHNLRTHHVGRLGCVVRCFDLWPKYACRFYHDAAARENRTCHAMT
ncbi:hypothetical protein HanHA300_Chr05g0184441 [Helianthus annuus]|nr:hypothetical protein HanHA300_Chr05g0184441 [Helianthus annuus]